MNCDGCWDNLVLKASIEMLCCVLHEEQLDLLEMCLKRDQTKSYPLSKPCFQTRPHNSSDFRKPAVTYTALTKGEGAEQEMLLLPLLWPAITLYWLNSPVSWLNSFVFLVNECVLSTCVPPNFTAWTVRKLFTHSARLRQILPQRVGRETFRKTALN